MDMDGKKEMTEAGVRKAEVLEEGPARQSGKAKGRGKW
jgi:hypothetical protein